MVSPASQCALHVVLYLYTILSIKAMAMAEIRKQVDGTLPHHLLFREVGRIDGHLQQMNRQNADDGHRQFDFQIITIVNRLAIITTSIRLSTANMTVFYP